MSDWLSRSRLQILAMADVWIRVLTEKAAEWNIDFLAVVAPLIAKRDKAKASFLRTLDTTTCTAVEYAQAEADFADLIEAMRFIKNNFLNSPPRTAAEMVSVKLHKHAEPSITPQPEHVLTGNTKPVANGILELTIAYVEKDRVHSAADYGNKISIAVEDAEGAAAGKSGRFGRYLAGPPECREDYTHSFFSHRMVNLVKCAEQDRGKKIWFCLSLENRKGWEGPPSVLFSSIIP
ncbi:hypothetical protein FACS1894137_19410 [Spirochaetia bacterium]|nr:hypothetical protein FACS1894137_19410 [Spirochaetia bacterium]